jgi:hypothetical protein
VANVTIYHNISRDAFFGFNYGNEDGNSPHYLVKVFKFDSSRLRGDSAGILAGCFHEFNVGETPLAAEYRARRLRSLSVGDIVDIDGRAYSCERVGWKPVNGSQMTVLDGSTAESHVRDRYDFLPEEPLSITVPLACATAEKRRDGVYIITPL